MYAVAVDSGAQSSERYLLQRIGEMLTKALELAAEAKTCFSDDRKFRTNLAAWKAAEDAVAKLGQHVGAEMTLGAAVGSAAKRVLGRR